MYGFSQGHVGDSNLFLNEFTQRLKDIYCQNWNATLNEKPKLQSYKQFKSLLECEKYLSCVQIKRHRTALTRFRLSDHDLGIEINRRNKSAEDCDKCKKCPNQIENEYHVLIVCPLYKSLREKYIKEYFWKYPSETKFITLMKTESETDLNKLACLVYNIFKMRNTS